MEVLYGSEVIDSKGEYLGKVDYIMRNSWSGEISKFMVQREAPGTNLFVPVGDVAKIEENKVTLSVTVEELQS